MIFAAGWGKDSNENENHSQVVGTKKDPPERVKVPPRRGGEGNTYGGDYCGGVMSVSSSVSHTSRIYPSGPRQSGSWCHSSMERMGESVSFFQPYK